MLDLFMSNNSVRDNEIKNQMLTVFLPGIPSELIKPFQIYVDRIQYLLHQKGEISHGRALLEGFKPVHIV
jgi:hypothetical protein